MLRGCTNLYLSQNNLYLCEAMLYVQHLTYKYSLKRHQNHHLG